MFIDYKTSALIIVDVQNDFCPAYVSSSGQAYPDGSLAVAGGGDVCKPLNIISGLFAKNGGKVVASQDWHPKGHTSFASAHLGRKPGDIMSIGVVESQILWPDHCIQGSWGSRFHENLNLMPVHLIVRKGFNPFLDSYSTFFENDRYTSTGLDGYLKAFSISTLFLGGLATDYCVLYSALDAVRLHYKTYIFTDAVRGVNFPKGSIDQAFIAMRAAGIGLITTKDIE
jgi:nicotinamidase/pyrazinamidase